MPRLIPPALYLVSALLTPVFLSACGGGSSTAQTLSGNQDTTITLGTQGKLTFPSGSLPPGSAVNVSETGRPVLTDDLTPVGRAWKVEVDQQPTLPVEVALPIPQGEDPSSLIMIRKQASGNITLLQSHVDNGLLKAHTPGFSTLLIARVQKHLKGFTPYIKGPEVIPTRIPAQYYEPTQATNNGLVREWRVFEMSPGMNAQLTQSTNPGNRSNVLVSADNAGSLLLQAEFTEPNTGLTALATQDISVQETLNAGSTVDINIQGPNSAQPGQALQFKIVVMNTDITSLARWEWQFGTHDGLCPAQCSAVFTIDNIEFPESAISKQLRVSVTTTDGTSSSARLTVQKELSELVVLGLDRSGDAFWDEIYNKKPEVILEGQIYGGTAPYRYDWSISPGPSASHQSDGISDRFSFTLDQPGNYRATLTVYDGSENYSTSSTLSFDLATRFPLQFKLSSDQVLDNIPLKQPFEATLEARGGILVDDGFQYDHYLYYILWGDGSNLERGTISATTPVQGGKIPLNHTYKEPGDYTIMYLVVPPPGLQTSGYIFLQRNELEVSVVAPPDPSGTICPASVKAKADGENFTLPFKAFTVDSSLQTALCEYEDARHYLTINLEYAPATGNDDTNLYGCGKDTPGDSGPWITQRWISGLIAYSTDWQMRVLENSGSNGEKFSNLQDASATLGAVLAEAAAQGYAELCPMTPALPEVTRPSINICPTALTMRETQTQQAIFLNLVSLSDDDTPDRYRSFCNYEGDGLNNEIARFHLTIAYTPASISTLDTLGCGYSQSKDVRYISTQRSAWSTTRTISVSWKGGPENFSASSMVYEPSVLTATVRAAVDEGLGEACSQ